MPKDSSNTRVRLSLDVEPEFRKQLKLLATERDMTIHDFVLGILRGAVAEGEREREKSEVSGWAGLSTRVFARDWDSEEDEVYDRLAQG